MDDSRSANLPAEVDTYQVVEKDDLVINIIDVEETGRRWSGHIFYK